MNVSSASASRMTTSNTNTNTNSASKRLGSSFETSNAQDAAAWDEDKELDDLIGDD
jgi:hypothetical protein